MRWKKRLFWVSALLGLGADQLTKFWVLRNFELAETRPFISRVLNLTYVQNRGAAFGLCEDCLWLPWLSALVCIALLSLGIWGPRLTRWEQAGYGFLLGGAAGNGLDRILLAYVVDFLQLPWLYFPKFMFTGGSIQLRWQLFPVFNIADICINVGLICLLIATWQSSRKKPRKPLV
ncbi:signal peptidase II [Acaryochloris sp. IP29b_bin.148]|uniref:signal peptidase II n=1 Tax=Acaryochloris sp. IP29b_bin.148 TaxID=2969218 RepID=UPI0026286242|nr:signal peptidase II [Acaryochloris sp. IP29b_bin.148]